MAKVFGSISTFAERMFNDVSDFVEDITDELSDKMKDHLVANGSIDTYQLYFSLRPDTERSSNKIVSTVLMDAQNPINGAYYGSFVNYGTGANHSADGGGRTSPWEFWSDKYRRWIVTDGQDPKPFIEPAIHDVLGVDPNSDDKKGTFAKLTAERINEFMDKNYKKL